MGQRDVGFDRPAFGPDSNNEESPMHVTRKPRVRWLVIMGVALALSTFAMAQKAPVAEGNGGGNCSKRSLSGDYGTLIEGTLLAPNWPLRTISMMHFDGAGSVTTSDFVVLNGSPTVGNWAPKTGTYSVNPDCTGTFVLEGVISTHFAVVNNGKDFRGVVDGDAITFAGSKVR